MNEIAQLGPELQLLDVSQRQFALGKYLDVFFVATWALYETAMWWGVMLVDLWS